MPAGVVILCPNFAQAEVAKRAVPGRSAPLSLIGERRISH
jgi:hypothetical protein